MSEWRKIGENGRNYPESQTCVVALIRGKAYVVYCQTPSCDLGGRFWRIPDEWADPTHWMPLPEFPKEANPYWRGK